VPLSFIAPGEQIGASRGDVVVCIPVYRGHEHFVACLESVLAHTPAAVRILVCDDASPDRRSQEHSEEVAHGVKHHVLYLRQEHNVGFPANANSALASAAPADVVLLNSDGVVAAGWLEGLRAAAHTDSAVATATALTNNGTIVSVPERWTPLPELPGGLRLEDAAAAVSSHSLRLCPRLPTAVGHCMYVRRSAVELVGDFDAAFSPGYGEEVDFSQRCLEHGLRHVAADDVLVLHHGGGSFAADGAPHPVQAEHERMLAHRYPYYHDAVRATMEDLSGPLARALGVARRALLGVTVTLDASGGHPGAGVAEGDALREALAEAGQVRATVITGPGRAESSERADVVHRLFPFADEEELRSSRERAERLVISHADLIAYHRPSSFPSFAGWERYRRLTKASLGAADHVIFPSEMARGEALVQGLVAPDRASVVARGIDHLGRRVTAGRLLEVYNATCDAPPIPFELVAAPASEPLSEDARRLVGPGGALPPELERPLLALATHPGIGRPLLAAIKAGYRAWRWLRRRRLQRP
jgi:GT2 family glycosyltransferase